MPSFAIVRFPMPVESMYSSSNTQGMHSSASVSSCPLNCPVTSGIIQMTKEFDSSYACHLFARHSLPSPSFSIRLTGLCWAAGRDSTGQHWSSSIGSPFITDGQCFGSNTVPFRALKGVRASRLAVDGVAGSPLAIAIRDLALTVKSDRGNVPVLKDCSLNVPEGQFWMLLGPNGCGKSTLLKVMAGLLRPNRGHMYVQGPRSFVFQNPDHQVVMPTADADVAFGIGRFDLPYVEVRRRVRESLEAVGMIDYAQRSVQTLSGGQKQRVAIAGALAESSRLLLLDELTTYLDSGDQIGVIEAVRKVVGGPQAVTALWVTHRMEELEYADGAAYMENGRVVISGSVTQIKQYVQKQQDEFRKGQEVLR